MKAYANWNYRPYIPADRYEAEINLPYICRIAPTEKSIEIEWLGEGEQAVLFHGKLSENSWQEMEGNVSKDGFNRFVIEGLEPDTDYRFYIKTAKSRSKTRYGRTGYVPGRVVNYLHPKDEAYIFSGSYLCSPSIVRLPDGKLITSMDVFRHKHPQNLTILCQSTDNGATWQYLSELFPCFWGKLFYHRDKLYMLATSTEYGDLLIGRSDDEGRTWSLPTVLMRGSSSTEENGFHKAPVTLVSSEGRLWSAVEYGSWVRAEYANAVISVDENADLLRAENWEISSFLEHDSDWEGAVEIRGGAIEGNIVEAPDGGLINMLRYTEGRAMQLSVDMKNPEKPMSFLRVVDFPMAHSKFEVQKVGELYVAVGNRLPKRNILSVYTSKDLINWTFSQDIINHEEMDVKEVGFQYPVFTFDDENLLVLSRTAFNKAANFHDSNYQTFHTLKLSSL